MISFIICLALLIGGYFVYGKVVENTFAPDDRETPAVRINDGVDYVVMPQWKLFLVQLLNIAGLGPIFGAMQGALWGPVVFLWITFGTIFAGGVHDYFSGMLSERNDGASISEVCGIYLGNVMKNVMRVFSVVLLVMVGTVFAVGPAGLIVTLLGNSDFMPGIQWGKERFWIRIRKTGDERNTEASQRTMIQEIWMNATEITAEETMDQEVFSIGANEKNAVFRLAAGNITKAEVWVQEHREYSEEQLAKLRQAYEIRTEKTEDGTVRHVWIRWEERENFASSTETDCHYMLDKNEGILQFSDGIHGRIPDDCGEASIRVRYRCGGGKRGNVPAGAVNRFRETTGFVNQVINPMDMSGGVDRENVETAIQRQGRAFRHRGRAVTAGDYEALAMESSGSILKAKCFPGQGRVNLVLLLREHNRELENFDLVKRECLRYMEDKIPASLLENRKFRILESRV